MHRILKKVSVTSAWMSFNPVLLCVFSLFNLGAHAEITTTTQQQTASHVAKLTQRFAQQRAVYQTTQQSLAQNPDFDISQAKLALINYPLLPFLEYADLVAKFNQLPIKPISAFQTQHKNSYIERELTKAWMNYLADHQHWALFLRFNDARFQTHSHRCHALQAELSLAPEKPTASAKAAYLKQVRTLWMSGYTLPKACDEPIAYLQAHNPLSQPAFWQRFNLAYARKNDSLANYLSQNMNEPAKTLAQRLLHAGEHSDYWLTRLSQSKQLPDLSSASYTRLLKILAGVDHLGLAGLVENYQLPLNEKDWLSVKTLSAWYFAKQDAAQSLVWIHQQKEKNTRPLQEKQLRYAMQAKDWQQYITSYEAAESTLRRQVEWQYWYALALLNNQSHVTSASKTAGAEKAQGILETLAQKQDFYGLLAAKLYPPEPTNAYVEDINLNDWPITDTTYLQLSAAIELFLLGDFKRASRQWYYTSKSFKRKQWREASAIAHQLQWYERMFRAIASSGFNRTISAQYPLAYISEFSQQSQQTGIDIGWLLAMSRQESAFAPLAKSSKGALGIMQLMPATAKRLAQRLELNFSTEQLLDPSINIYLGSHYLQQLLARYDNNYVLATAAYNAGPHRVDEWLSYRPLEQDWSHWIAAIPYRETRKYVQNILAFSHVYHQQLPADMQSEAKLTLFQ